MEEYSSPKRSHMHNSIVWGQLFTSLEEESPKQQSRGNNTSNQTNQPQGHTS